MVCDLRTAVAGDGCGFGESSAVRLRAKAAGGCRTPRRWRVGGGRKGHDFQGYPIDSNEFQSLFETIMKPSTQNQNDGDLWQMRVGRGVGSVEVNQGAWVGRRGARGGPSRTGKRALPTWFQPKGILQ